MVGREASGLAPDVGAFLGRLTRLDPQALVRVRSERESGAREQHAELWARVPWGVLVTRFTDRGALGAEAQRAEAELLDVTVRASAWLNRADGNLMALPRLDAAWGAALPSSAGRVRETIEDGVIRSLAEAAADTLRAAAEGALGARSVGERAIRDALLDHVPIVVESDGERIEVTQRLIQAVVRMGFLGRDSSAVRIRTIGPWVGISAAYGAAWRRSQNAENPTLLPTPSRR
jgi:hypothetical protein